MSTSAFSTIFWVFDQNFSLVFAGVLGHFLWQGCILACLAAMLESAIRHRGPRWGYTLHLVTLGLMLACLPWNYYWLTRSHDTNIVHTKTWLYDETNMSLSSVPHARKQENVPNQGAASTTTHLASNLDARETNAQITYAWFGDTPPSRYVLQSAAPWIVRFYVLGVALMLLRLSLGIAATGRWRRQARVVTDNEFLARFHALARRLGLRRTPIVSICHRVAVPMVVGIARPMVLLPLQLTSSLRVEQWEALLAHEFAHIRRWDPWFNFAQRIVETCFFYHPLVWYISGRASALREECCDDLVVQSGWHRLGYADALVRMAECRTASMGLRPTWSMVGLAAQGVHRSHFMARIMRLLDPSRGSASVGPLPVLGHAAPISIAVVGILMLLLFLSLPRQGWTNTEPSPAPTGTQAENDDKPSDRKRVPAAAGADAKPVAPRPQKNQGEAHSPKTNPNQEVDKKDSEKEKHQQRAVLIAKGLDYLKRTQSEQGTWPVFNQGDARVGATALAVLALLQEDQAVTSAPVQRALAYLRALEPRSTYTVALQTIVFCRADPRNSRPLILRNIRFFAESQATEGSGRGGWSYSLPRSQRADGSNTRFGLWALAEARAAGFSVDDAIWTEAANYWLNNQRTDGSWGYTTGANGTINMTLAGIAGVSACRDALRNSAKPGLSDLKMQASIQKGWLWMEKEFPRQDYWNSRKAWGYYGLHCLELAVFYSKTPRAAYWREECARTLVERVPLQGNWGGGLGEPDTIAISFGLLALEQNRKEK